MDDLRNYLVWRNATWTPFPPAFCAFHPAFDNEWRVQSPLFLGIFATMRACGAGRREACHEGERKGHIAKRISL